MFRFLKSYDQISVCSVVILRLEDTKINVVGHAPADERVLLQDLVLCH
jgi:hypothetical protein